jgi:hypothetical protein
MPSSYDDNYSSSAIPMGSLLTYTDNGEIAPVLNENSSSNNIIGVAGDFTVANAGETHNSPLGVNFSDSPIGLNFIELNSIEFHALSMTGNTPIERAREVFKKTFEEDEDFRRAYKDNIAMLLHDRFDIVDYKIRNEIADSIMEVIFDAKTIEPSVVDREDMIQGREEILDL